jgi:predicted nucleic acid-binding protein
VSALVVDTSVWIDFFNGRDVPRLEAALDEGRVIVPPIVVAELASGAKKPRDRASIEDLLLDLEIHATPLAHWLRVGALRRLLASKGVSISTPDAHVAQCAIDRAALLLTRDSVFQDIAEIVPLQLAER